MRGLTLRGRLCVQGAGSCKYRLSLQPWYEWAAEPADMPSEVATKDLLKKIKTAFQTWHEPIRDKLLPGMLTRAVSHAFHAACIHCEFVKYPACGFGLRLCSCKDCVAGLQEQWACQLADDRLSLIFVFSRETAASPEEVREARTTLQQVRLPRVLGFIHFHSYNAQSCTGPHPAQVCLPEVCRTGNEASPGGLV